MSDQRKTRPDARLKLLPSERQAEIYERLGKAGYDDVRGWLAQDGLRVGRTALAEFYSWYALRLTFQQTEADTENFLELLKRQLPELPAAKLTELGDTFFNLQAIKKQDPKLFLAMQGAKQKARMDQLKFEQRERQIALEERRIALLEVKAARADQAEAAMYDDSLTPEEQRARLKQIFGMT